MPPPSLPAYTPAELFHIRQSLQRERHIDFHSTRQPERQKGFSSLQEKQKAIADSAPRRPSHDARGSKNSFPGDDGFFHASSARSPPSPPPSPDPQTPKPLTLLSHDNHVWRDESSGTHDSTRRPPAPPMYQFRSNQATARRPTGWHQNPHWQATQYNSMGRLSSRPPPRRTAEVSRKRRRLNDPLPAEILPSSPSAACRSWKGMAAFWTFVLTLMTILAILYCIPGTWDMTHQLYDIPAHMAREALTSLTHYDRKYDSLIEACNARPDPFVTCTLERSQVDCLPAEHLVDSQGQPPSTLSPQPCLLHWYNLVPKHHVHAPPSAYQQNHSSTPPLQSSPSPLSTSSLRRTLEIASTYATAMTATTTMSPPSHRTLLAYLLDSIGRAIDLLESPEYQTLMTQSRHLQNEYRANLAILQETLSESTNLRPALTAIDAHVQRIEPGVLEAYANIAPDLARWFAKLEMEMEWGGVWAGLLVDHVSSWEGREGEWFGKLKARVEEHKLGVEALKEEFFSLEAGAGDGGKWECLVGGEEGEVVRIGMGYGFKRLTGEDDDRAGNAPGRERKTKEKKEEAEELCWLKILGWRDGLRKVLFL